MNQVRDYCRKYHIAGGIGEYGTVFYDHFGQKEIKLASEADLAELATCRKLLSEIPGVFLDPGYEVTVRAHRYGTNDTIGLQQSEINELFQKAGLTRLTCIAKEANTYILPKANSKGAAVEAVKSYRGNPKGPHGAIGDSVEDFEMLKAVDLAFIPSNGEPALLTMAGQLPSCRLMDKPVQRGLFAAALSLRKQITGDDWKTGIEGLPSKLPSHVLHDILKALDQPRRKQLAAALAGHL